MIHDGVVSRFPHSAIASPPTPCNFARTVAHPSVTSSTGYEFALISDENGRILPNPFRFSLRLRRSASVQTPRDTSC